MAKRTPRSQASDAAALNAPVSDASARSRPRAGAPRRVAAAPEVGAPTPPASFEYEPPEDEVRERAYQLYLERGGHDGADFDDWIRAREELRRSRRS